jgi:hypothetical protein
MSIQYTTPEDAPSCVQYWEKELSSTTLWFDWIVLKTVVESEIPNVMNALSCDKNEATQTVWTSFIEATCGDKQSSCYRAYKDFMRRVDEYHFAYWTPRLTIGSDLHDGYSLDKAKQRYANWLNEKPENPIFGRYVVKPDLSIVQHKRKRR